MPSARSTSGTIRSPPDAVSFRLPVTETWRTSVLVARASNVRPARLGAVPSAQRNDSVSRAVAVRSRAAASGPVATMLPPGALSTMSLPAVTWLMIDICPAVAVSRTSPAACALPIDSAVAPVIASELPAPVTVAAITDTSPEVLASVSGATLVSVRTVIGPATPAAGTWPRLATAMLPALTLPKVSPLKPLVSAVTVNAPAVVKLAPPRAMLCVRSGAGPAFGAITPASRSILGPLTVRVPEPMIARSALSTTPLLPVAAVKLVGCCAAPSSRSTPPSSETPPLLLMALVTLVVPDTLVTARSPATLMLPSVMAASLVRIAPATGA